MKRRDFLRASGRAGGLVALPLALGAPLARALQLPAGFSLAYCAESRPGAAWQPLQAIRPAARPDPAQPLRIRIDGMQHAATPVLAELRLDVLFELPGRAALPFNAWSYRGGRVASASKPIRFVASADALQRLVLDYRLDGETACRREACALVADRGHLSPGHYLLASPRRGGTEVEWQGRVHSGDPRAPLRAGADALDFDVLAFRVESLA